MAKKILILGVALMMCLGLFAGCGEDKNVEFTVGTAWGNNVAQSIKMIVRTLDEWNDSDVANKITIDEKYDNTFFVDNALIIVAFATTFGGGEVQEIKVIKRGNRLAIDIKGIAGVQTIMSQIVVALEVKKNDIIEVNNISFESNIPKA